MSAKDDNQGATERRRSSVTRVSRRTTSIMEENPDFDESEYVEYKNPFKAMMHQIHAMMYRKWIRVKRTIVSILINMLITLIVSILSIIVQVLLETLVTDSFTTWDFNNFVHNSDHVVIVADDYDNKWWQRRYVDAISYLFQSDKGRNPIFHMFSSVDEANRFAYRVNTNQEEGVDFLSLGFILPTEYSKFGGNNLTVIYNDTESINMDEMSATNELTLGYAISVKIELAMLTMPPDDTDPDYAGLTDEQKNTVQQRLQEAGFNLPSCTQLIKSTISSSSSNSMFALMAPMLMSAGILSITSTIIPNPITDIQGPIRSYMVSCGLTLFPYWIVTYIFDLLLYEIDVLIIWIIFVAAGIENFTDNLGMTYYILFISGFSLILFIYCMSFLFTNPNNAARNAFLLIIVLLMIPSIVMIIGIEMDDPFNSMSEMEPAYWVYALFPPMLLEGYMQDVFLEYQYNHDGIRHYFTSASSAQCYSIFSLVDIVIYAVILFIIEKYRIHVQRLAAKTSFGNYGDFFKEQKAKHPVTPEADEMAKEVANNHDYAVRIENVSRLFFNTEGNPIPAVNCVSLGVKEGSIFGFLGANGAGKTTLINMITSMLPMSDGKIEINGKDISTDNDPSLLSVCPQFNTHLCTDMTIAEHLHFYSLLHCMTKEQEKRNTNRLISLLNLDTLKDIPIKELSEGDVRKLSIALSFLGKAKIILLDEPTATLDPVSMTQVHEMMLFYKGKKTFMLCTHLLSEAEALCDMISIMIKGNVYTCGSPQYLSSKFGTDFKIDLMLNDSSEENAAKIDAFFEGALPQAKLNIARPTARIYNVPANLIRLDELFRIMEEGKKGDNGYNYYTCSSSSLEKVFMEIVHLSENDDAINT